MIAGHIITAIFCLFMFKNFTFLDSSKVLRYGPCVTRDHTVLSATHTRTIPAFTPPPQGITAIWLVLSAPTHKGMARLS